MPRTSWIVVGMAVLSAVGVAQAGYGTTTRPVVISTTAVSLTVPRAMVATADRLFVSDADSVAVLDTSGTLTDRIPGLPDASGLALSPDRSTVYVAVRGAARIEAIDVASLAVTDEIPTPACPSSVAAVGRKLFWSAGCNSGRIGGIDLVTRRPSGPPNINTFPLAPTIAGAAGTLLMLGNDVRPELTTVTTYSVSGTRVGYRSGGDVLRLPDVVDGATLTPDGSRMIAGTEDTTGEGTTAGFAEIGTYGGQTRARYAVGFGFPSRSAVSPAGAYLAGLVTDDDTAHLDVWNRRTGQRRLAVEVPQAATVPAGTGLVFGPDERSVYLLAGAGPFYLLHLDLGPTRAGSEPPRPPTCPPSTDSVCVTR